ncbi:MAG: hypothetical protein ABI330_12000 [Caldimonas sp.]|nr:hypothetical protein [Pseudomonadota bacterium]
MKALISVVGTLCLAAVPTFASANCYFVYSAQNQLVYRSTISPVDLSRPISEGLRGRFAGGHLTMIADETGCPDLLTSGESQVFASFGFTPAAGARSVSAIDASPLFRSLDSRTSGTTYNESAVTPADVSGRSSARRTAPNSATATRGK